MDPAPPIIGKDECKPADLQTLMCVMDLAEQSRNKLEEFRLDDPEQLALNKEALAKQLREHYQKQGVAMPEEAIADAVEEFTSSQSRFQNTLTGFHLFLARVYIKRVPVISVGIVILALAGLAGWQSARQNHALRLGRAAAVRQRVSDTARRLADLQQSSATEHEEQKRIAVQGAQLTSADSGTTALETALRQWGQTENEEFTAVQGQSGTLVKQLEAIKTSLAGMDAPPVKLSEQEEARVEAIVQGIDPLERKVKAEGARLEDERLALRDWTEEVGQNRRAAHLEKLGPVDRQTFLTNLQAAQNSLQGAHYEEAARVLQANTQLAAAADEAERRQGESRARIAEAGDKIKTLLARVRAEAAGEGKAEVESRIKEEQLDLPAGDLPELEGKLASLRKLEAVLNTAFHLRISTGSKTGVQRTAKGSRANQWYIIVEAADDNNNRVAFPVTSVETGKTASVSSWGEAVPDAVFQEIRDEKKRLGVVNNREFGVKRRGSLKIDYTRIDRPIGEITSW